MPLSGAAADGIATDKDLQSAVTASVVPVKHTIRIEAVK